MRYAIYYAPDPGSPLWRFGSSIIGYDAHSGADVAQPDLPHLTRAVTEAPRRYGFHGTLKAPFLLADGHTPDDLAAACRAFKETVPVISLTVAAIGSFIALVPDRPSPELDTLAAAVVRAFEPFRAPLSPDDRARRNPDKLTPRQVRHLDDWGYPYVFEDFRFHMTLTGPIANPALRNALLAGLGEAWEAEHHGPVAIDALALFTQATRADRFVMRERFPLAA